MKRLWYITLLLVLLPPMAFGGMEDRGSWINLKPHPHDYVELPDVATPSRALTTTPSSGWSYLYMYSDALLFKTDGGIKEVIGGSRTSTATTTTVNLTREDSGKVLISGSSGTRYNLPSDPTDIVFYFVVGTNGQQLKVVPDLLDQIILKTADTYYYYWADALGETLILRGLNTSQWASFSEIGTWTDGGAP